MTIIVDNAMRIPLEDIGLEAVGRIQERLTMRNPAYDQAIARLRSQGRGHMLPYGPDGKPIHELIYGWRIDGRTLTVPRGCAGEIMEMLGLGMGDVEPRLTHKKPVEFKFRGRLKRVQEPAVDAILQRRFGCLEAPTGSGKTIMGLYAIARRQQPALVVVHTSKLLHQWVERACEFLGLDEAEIGIIGQGRREVGERLTVALVQTLHKCAGEIQGKIGHLIVDEVHHVPANTVTKAVAAFASSYMLGLSATHQRADGLHPLIYWYLGPLVHRVPRQALLEEGIIVEVEPVFRRTGWRPDDGVMKALEDRTAIAAAGYRGEAIFISKDERRNANTSQAALISAMVNDAGRNDLIAADVAVEAGRGPCIVLTDRKAHAEELASLVAGRGIAAAFCHGGVPKDLQVELTADLNNGRLQVLVGTGQLLGEGFDCKRLTALFLATPVKFSGRLIQFLGRVARGADGKAGARVYDYHDEDVPVLMRQARERMRTYKRLMAQGRGPTKK